MKISTKSTPGLPPLSSQNPQICKAIPSSNLSRKYHFCNSFVLSSHPAGFPINVILEHQLDDLPALVSYSPLSIPLASGETLNLARRDLFDARFQLISEGRGEEDGDRTEDKKIDPLASALDFLDTPSDLVPGIYEGGLKTWECSLDLVNYLEQLKGTPSYGGIIGKRSLEVRQLMHHIPQK